MQMLTKFESKSNRVKGIAFHPRLPLLAASLHNGSIQLWNYQTGTIYDRLDEHDGPVRGVCFHQSQPLLVSGGDDYKIKVWNHKTRRCLFTLNGHLDYVRTVYFHHEHPWILSASDDQTIRIWNWQSRTCIAILTGHNHYIMSAQFHPREDLIVSACMDQTVRVWDISGLVKKATTASSTPAMAAGASMGLTLDEQIARANANAGGIGMGMSMAGGAGQGDLFGNTDAMVKYVLEGHDRGVNWASFHPTLPLIISGGDDRQLKLWRMSETKAWEVDTCRGHFNNVSSVLFHPRHELLVSAGEDKTIRVWDMGKRTAVATFRRETERFWVLTAHPTLNLFAAGHDNGLIVFKLERERPAMAIHNDQLFYVRDKVVRSLDFETGKDEALLSVRKLGNQYIQPRTLSYNPAERSVIVTSVNNEQGVYDLAPLPRDGSGEIAESSSVGKRGQGSAAIFVARNRLAVLDKTTQTIEIRDLNNTGTKSIKTPSQTSEIFFGGTASLLLSTTTGVTLFDIQQQRVISEVTSPTVKYVAWSLDNSMVALLSKHTITIANKTLGGSCLIHETIRIKSAAWDDAGVLIYSTLNHIKYALPNGDSGIIKTLEQPVYLTRVRGKVVSALDRSARPLNISIDPTEYRFKLALVQQKYDEVLRIIQSSNLVGQAIIAYLQKKGYPEIALHFVQDKSTRFDLAIECGNLDVALETAEAINREEVWDRLGSAALKQGDHRIVERAYQKTKNFERLSFLYLITGNTEKLAKMAVIAEKRGDEMARFHNALFLGDSNVRVNVLESVGLAPLAYATAKANGDLDRAAAIAEQAGMTPGLSELEMTGKLGGAPSTTPLKPPPIVTESFTTNWPLLGGTESFFDKALVANAEEGGVIFKDNAINGARKEHDTDNWLDGDAFVDAEDEFEEDGAVGAITSANAEVAEEAWDLDDEDFGVEAEEDPVVAPLSDVPEPDSLAPGSSELEHWLRNSPLAADHAAAGSFETAMKLLQRQAGVVNFVPLKPHFLALHAASQAFLPGAPNVDSLRVPLRRNEGDVQLRKDALPALPVSVRDLSEKELQEAYKAVSGNQLEQAQTLFRALLLKLVMTAGRNETEGAEISALLVLCREYLLGISIELERRILLSSEAASTPEGIVRLLELAALFTHVEIQAPHKIIALRSAMVAASKAGNHAMAASFAKRLLDVKPPATEKVRQAAQAAITAADRSPRDAVPVPGYDSHERHFAICAGSHVLLPAGGAGSVEEPLTGARYKKEYEGQVCVITQVSEIGRQASGLRTWV